MAAGKLDILFEDNHLLVINKPAGLATMGVQSGQDSLVVRAKEYIKRRYDKPGNVYLGVVSRLDTGTSGAVVLARTSKAAARLSEQFRTRAVQKIYWAIVSGQVDPATAELLDWVRKNESRQRMEIVPGESAAAKEARLRYTALRPVSGGTLLEIELLTGRKHQIRLQLSARGWPVWGESKYAQGRPFEGLALHARRLAFEHPVRKTPLDLTAPLPASWRKLGVD